MDRMQFTTRGYAEEHSISVRRAQEVLLELLQTGAATRERGAHNAWLYTITTGQDKVTVAEVVERDRKARQAKEAERLTKKKYSRLSAEAETLQKQVDLLLALDSHAANEPPRDRRIETRTGSGDEVVPVLMLSDVHAYERVDPRTINHINEYNPDICTARTHNVVRNALTLIAKTRKGGNPVKSMVLWLGGDFINGFIHEEYLVQNFGSPVEELIFAQNLLREVIDTILNDAGLEDIRVVCNYGNHGRSTMKMYSSGASTSYEWMLYHFLKQQYAGEERLHWTIADGYMAYQDVLGTRLCFHHGDAVRYGGGVGGLWIPLKKKIMAWAQQTPRSVRPFHVLGHFHQLLYDPKHGAVNGSIIGYNAYAQKLGCEMEPPQQGMFYICEESHQPVQFCTVWADK